MKAKRKKFVVISGPSGAGKSTLIKSVLTDEFFGKYLMLSVSHTTRKRRKGERNGREYFFVSEEEFRRMIKKSEFLEWAEVHGNLYGTSKWNIEEAEKRKKTLILDIDVQGARTIRKKKGKDALFIFIKPPSLNELKKRLEKRGDTSPEDIKLRLNNAKNELKHEKDFDISVVNDDIKKAIFELKVALCKHAIDMREFTKRIFSKRKKELRELTRKLVSIKSVSGEEKEIALFLEGELKKLGFKVKRQYVGKGRFNVLGWSDDSPPRFMLSTHMDTVPELGMKNAFSPVEEGGRIKGRGSADTKGAIAGLLIALRAFRDVFGRNPAVFICFTVDEEEWTSYGSERALELIPPSCREAIIFEPTSLRLCTAQEGSFEFELSVRVKTAHASVFERYENPAKLLFSAINLVERELKRKVSVLMVRSGWRYYAVPPSACALGEVKLKKGEKIKKVKDGIKKALERMKKSKSGAKFILKTVDSEEFIDFGMSDIGKILRDVLGEFGFDEKESIMPSWTDASNFRKKLKCVIFGPGKIDDCHTERESISLNEVLDFSRILFSALIFHEGRKKL